MGDHPYRSLPANAFWRTAVAEAGIEGLGDLWTSPWTLPPDARFSTYGSCFAQHISRALKSRKMNWLNCERAPGKLPQKLKDKYNFGVFSARTGNIYTAAQMLTWARLAAGEESVDHLEYWTDPAGRVFDLLRPRIEPDGFVDLAEAHGSVETTRRAFRKSIVEADVFVFTLGLTEGWRNRKTGQSYSICPGTLVGDFDPDAHVFHNYTYPEIRADLEAAFDLCRQLNPGVHILLTVSPVPLVASASGNHVLPATQYSKSVLRAVAGDLAQQNAFIDYFPSYEIIASPPSKAQFFEPDMRSVRPEGVNLVMSHFFAGLDLSAPIKTRAPDPDEAAVAASKAEMEAEDLVCEEMALETFNAH